MRIRPVWPVAIGSLVLLAPHPATAQTGSTPVIESIDANERRPLAKALETLGKRYGFAITYEDPVYSHPMDLAPLPNVSPLAAGPVIVPRGGAFHFQYLVENGKPREDTGTLIRRMLVEYAALGNPTFDLQERTIKPRPEWHVIPVKVRNKNGDFVRQTALLDNILYISKQKRTYDAMFEEIYGQLRALSGREIIGGLFPVNAFYAARNEQHEWEAANRPARDVLADLLGPSLTWRLLYDPGKDLYVLNIQNAPSPPSHIAAAPLVGSTDPHSINSLHVLSDPAHPASREEACRHRSGAVLSHYPLSRERIVEVQSALAGAGYYQGDPTGAWDPNTITAMRKFQSANNLAPSGRWDGLSLERLGIAPCPPASGVASK
jgi:hypothetical protein